MSFGDDTFSEGYNEGLEHGNDEGRSAALKEVLAEIDKRIKQARDGMEREQPPRAHFAYRLDELVTLRAAVAAMEAK